LTLSDLHKIQRLLLKRLVKKNGLKYSKLTRGYNYEDNVVFHLKQLISNKQIQKRNSKYFLTSKGLIDSGKFDLKSLQEKGVKKVTIGFIIGLGNKYVIREHIGGGVKFYRLPWGKPFFGEKMSDACKRLLKKEIDAPESIKFKFDSNHYKIQYTSNGEILFDDLLAVYKVIIPDKSQKDAKLKYKNKLFTASEIKKLANKWPEVDICLLRKGWKAMLEYDLVCDYNLEKVDVID
jgi:hypothetical protein